MKRGCLFCLILFCSLLLMAQTKYEVTANTFLNIRSYADKNAPVVATIDRGGKVNVYEITNGWAKISYGDGFAYVSADYIKPLSSPKTQVGSDSSFDFGRYWGHGSQDMRMLVFVILGCSVVLFIIRKVRGEHEPLEDSLHIANWIIFLITSALEIFYIMSMGASAIWFCIPDDVGWMWTIIDFFIFGFVVYNQFQCLMNTLLDVQYNSYAVFNWKWGLYSWVGGVIAAVVCGFFFQPGLVIVGIAFLICQLVQVILIFTNVVPKGGWGHAILCTVVYLAGSVATVAILAHFLVMLIIVLIGLFILSIFGKSTGSSHRRCSNCSYYSGHYCSYRGESISNPSTSVCDGYR